MLNSRIDHLVITAPSLAAGVEYVRHVLGVTPQIGGEHLRMGTHNALLRLGEAVYLEVIAINPHAPKPDRPRWFELDRLAGDATPRLAAWVARTNDIQAAVAASSLSLGSVETMNRGEYRWLITIPADGGLIAQGIAPLLIQWLSEPHPAATLTDQGCTLIRLECFHPEPGAILGMLSAIGFEGSVSVFPCSPGELPRLAASIQTPGGVRQLDAA